MKVSGVGLGVTFFLFGSQALAQAPAASAAAPAPASSAAFAPSTAAPLPPAPAPAVAPTAPAPAEPPPPEAGTPAPADAPAPAKPVEARVHWVDNSAESPAPAPEEPASTTNAEPAWSMLDATFVLSIDRATSLLAWNKVETVQVSDGFNSFTTHPVDFKSSGVDTSFLTAGTGRSASSIPRLGFDFISRPGVTLGGSLGYMVSSGKIEQNEVVSERDLGDEHVLVLAFRMGYLLQTSDHVGIWLRGGISHVSAKSHLDVVTPQNTFAAIDDTTTIWDATIDPQFVFTVAPHAAITLGGLLDIGFTGSEENATTGDQPPVFKSSAYGVTGGFALLL